MKQKLHKCLKCLSLVIQCITAGQVFPIEVSLQSETGRFFKIRARKNKTNLNFCKQWDIFCSSMNFKKHSFYSYADYVFITQQPKGQRPNSLTVRTDDHRLKVDLKEKWNSK